MTEIINLWGGPGSGKSTTAAALFARMKLLGLKVELAHEFAKEIVYSGDLDTLTDQWYVTGHQARRLRYLIGKVDWVVTDSPLPLGCAYASPPFDQEGFKSALWWLYGGFDNRNVFIKRTKPYANYGRTQTEDEADQKAEDIFGIYLRACGCRARGLEVPGDQEAASKILYWLGLA